MRHSGSAVAHGVTVNQSAGLKSVKRKLVMDVEVLTEEFDGKLGKVESQVVKKVEGTNQDLSSSQDGMSEEINRFKAIKISDVWFGGAVSEHESSSSSTSGSKVEDML